MSSAALAKEDRQTAQEMLPCFNGSWKHILRLKPGGKSRRLRAVSQIRRRARFCQASFLIFGFAHSDLARRTSNDVYLEFLDYISGIGSPPLSYIGPAGE